MTTTTTTARVVPSERRPLRSVAVPSEHGGWGLTTEPGVLGLLIAPSLAGTCIALGAVIAFLARTPIKIALVDRRRRRSLPRTRLASRVAIAELSVLVVLGVTVALFAEPWFWVPGLVAVPFVAVEGWYEIRSRGRRLVPELAGAIGVCSVAPMILLAGGASARLATATWLVLTARVVTSIPNVRRQISKLRGRPTSSTGVLVADGLALLIATASVLLDGRLAVGAAGVVAVVVVQRALDRRTIPRPVVLGIAQTALGFGLAVAAAVGVIVTT